MYMRIYTYLKSLFYPLMNPLQPVDCYKCTIHIHPQFYVLFKPYYIHWSPHTPLFNNCSPTRIPMEL